VIAVAIAEGLDGEAVSIAKHGEYRLPDDAIAVSASLFDELVYRYCIDGGDGHSWIDALQVAAYLGRRRGLNQVAAGFGLGNKLASGTDLIRRLCRGRDSRGGRPDRCQQFPGQNWTLRGKGLRLTNPRRATRRMAQAGW
jgi:hypothetical protein